LLSMAPFSILMNEQSRVRENPSKLIRKRPFVVVVVVIVDCNIIFNYNL
jgi:hypothetical protein